MSRIIFFLALGLGLYLFIRHYARKSSSSHKDNVPSQDTVQCAQCNTYVPKNEAEVLQGQYFCCKQHARDWSDARK